MSNVWDDDKIREAFIYDGGESEYHDPVNGAQTQRKVAGDIFDRWLAEHDAKVRAETFREAAQTLRTGLRGSACNEGCHKADRITLEMRADRIEREAGLK